MMDEIKMIYIVDRVRRLSVKKIMFACIWAIIFSNSKWVTAQRISKWFFFLFPGQVNEGYNTIIFGSYFALSHCLKFSCFFPYCNVFWRQIVFLFYYELYFYWNICVSLFGAVACFCFVFPPP